MRNLHIIYRKIYATLALTFISVQAELVKQIRECVTAHLSQGHTRIDLIELSNQLNGVNVTTLANTIYRFMPELVVVHNYVTTTEFSLAESQIVKGIKEAGSRLRKIDPQVVKEYLLRNHPNLSDEQHEAALRVINSPVAFLVGGPGCGKTTTLKAILGALQTFGYSVSLAAPTGRAAERMTEATGVFAQTIHRLLYFSPRENRWLRMILPNRRDAICVDEFSMMDTMLTAKLFQSASPYTRIIGLGDEEQIPSIGNGAILRDLIASNQITVCRLTQTHRQKEGSKIVDLTQSMRHGRTIDWVKPGEGKSDVYFIHAPNDHAITATIAKAMKSLPARLGYNAATDIQVLTTIHAGTAGTNNLNASIRKAMHNKETLPQFAVGDRVLHTKNNRRMRISNGNVGIVTKADTTGITVAYPNRSLHYNRKEQVELTHAHAMSVYKAQGSEFKVVIIPLSASQTQYWNRPLLFTAASRPKELLIFVGDESVYEAAMSDVSPYHRQTGLSVLLTK